MHTADPQSQLNLGSKISTNKGTANGPKEKLARRAHAIAWASIACGAVSGMVMGLWSFNGPFSVPAWIGEYDALPRRFLRLAHIAFFALGILHIMMAKRLEHSDMPKRPVAIAVGGMAFGNAFLPFVLMGAAVFEPIKYLSPFPVSALSIAFLLIAYDAIRQAWRTKI